MGSPAGEATEGYDLLRRLEVPPPVRRKTLNLYEEEDSLLEAQRRVSCEEEPLMDMTSQSTKGCWIEPSESEMKEDIVIKNTLKAKKTNEREKESQSQARRFKKRKQKFEVMVIRN